MKKTFVQGLRASALITLLMCAALPGAKAEPIAVRYGQGNFHGFLELRSEDGRVVASGDCFQLIHGDRLTLEAVFHFKDGSIDDETTVFTQHGTFQMITDRRIQKGPSFPHPMDVLIDARSGTVTVRSPGKDGKEEVKTDHLKLPPDLANGMIPLVLENLRPNAAGATVSMVVMTPKPRVVKLVVSKLGEDNTSVAGAPRKAIHYEIKIDLGGLVAVVAPLIGKAPPNIECWLIGGPSPTFIREVGPLYSEGPMMTIQLASPVWPEPQKAGN
jgi:hypothetical protein